MCDFEDVDLHQVRAARGQGGEWKTPDIYTGQSMEELREDEAEADDQEEYTNEGGEHE
jgi:hypothetical protein